jgi:hypothetical protein
VIGARSLHQVERLLRHQRSFTVCVFRHHQQRVAVGCRLRHRVGADDRAAAGTVLDDERLAERVRELGSDESRVDVGRAARRRKER